MPASALREIHDSCSQLGAASSEQLRDAAELRRANALLAGGWVSLARVDTAQAAYDSAVAGTRVRRFATDTARIYALSTGVVLARPAEPSQVVDSGTPVFVLGEEARDYVLKVPLSDHDAARATGNSLSFLAVIGFVALIGIEIKHSILLVDFTTQLGGRGQALREAIQKAGEIRFLPVLHTSVTAIGGLLPLALSGSPALCATRLDHHRRAGVIDLAQSHRDAGDVSARGPRVGRIMQFSCSNRWVTTTKNPRFPGGLAKGFEWWA